VNIVKEADFKVGSQDLFDYILDFKRHSEWTTPGHGVSITPASDGPPAVGSTFVATAHQFGSQRDEIRITELVPGSRVVYEVTMKDGNTFRHSWEVTPAPGGSHLVKRFESLKLNVISKLTLPIGMLVAPKMMAGDLTRMKSRLEMADS
jgi:uncharacterized protein YndB with AHSA1/START domain